MAQISAGSRVLDIIQDHPGAKKVFKKRGMLCSSCQGSENETLRLAARNHGQPLTLLIDELNAALKSGD
jgi:hybrid cluster-associated redox disulfide protein